MATGETGVPERGWPELRRPARPPAFAARVAGLYSEVTWDGDRDRGPSRWLTATADAEARSAPSD